MKKLCYLLPALVLSTSAIASDDIPTINGCQLVPKTECKGVDLRGADLSNIDLSGANLPEQTCAVPSYATAR